MTIDPEFIGYTLLNRGFKDWFLVMFKLVENRPFIIEPIHEDLFNSFQGILDGNIKRISINIAPRAGKTVMAKYFTAYTITVNPRSNIIYTSFSQSLLATIARELVGILENPAYKRMYPLSINKDELEENAVNEFWRELAEIENKDRKNTYTSRKIITAQGGNILFNSIGSAITGFGAGVRNSKKFSGFLLLDDANKPNEMRSEVYREKVVEYYEGTLLNRLNNADVPIVNIQQRLHLEDLSGVLENKYKFKVVKKPLLNDEGVCQLPSQYTVERIKELQMNNYFFISQYQQEPIVLGGEVIKREWFKYYDINEVYKYKRVLITGDTAFEVKKHNDFSAFIVGGVTQDNRLHVFDLLHGKWEAPDLEAEVLKLWNKHKRDQRTGLVCNGLYVEKKASGIGLIQSLKKKYGIPIMGLEAERDKLARVESVLPYIQAGMVMLPCNENYGFNPIILRETESFTRNDSHKHDDITDALGYLIRQALANNKVSLLDYFME